MKKKAVNIIRVIMQVLLVIAIIGWAIGLIISIYTGDFRLTGAVTVAFFALLLIYGMTL